METGLLPRAVHDGRHYLHGTRSLLRPGQLLAPGHFSSLGARSRTRHVYLTSALNTATWEAEVAAGEGPARIYRAEPTGPLEDDPHLADSTDPAAPANPTRSYRTREAVRVMGEVTGWPRHTPEALREMRAHLDALHWLNLERYG